MRQRRLGMEIVSNFAMFHIASHFAQFQGISNPLFPVKQGKETQSRSCRNLLKLILPGKLQDFWNFTSFQATKTLTGFSGLVVQWLRCWILNPGVLCTKLLNSSKVDSAFHPSDVDKISTRNFCKLSGKKYTNSSKWLYQP